MFCTKCGAQVGDNDKFCPECGTPIESAPNTAAGSRPAEITPAAAYDPQPAPKKSHKALWIVLICVAAAVVAACVLLLVLRPWQKCGRTVPAAPATSAPASQGGEASKPAVPIAELEPEETIRAAFEALNNVESMHLDFSETVSMSIGLPSVGYTQDMDIAIALGIDSRKNPNISKTEGYMEMMGERQNILMYSEESDGKTHAYRSDDGGKTWTESDTELDEDSVLNNPVQAFDLWMQHAKNFEKTGTETINGFDTTVISGTLSGEYVQEAMSMTGDLFGEPDEDLWKELDDLPITFWIDNAGGCVVRMRIDMQDMMKSLLENAMQKSVGELPDGMELSIEVGTATADCVMTQFNAVPEIVIPDEAKGTLLKPDPEPETESIVGTWTLCGGETEETQQYVDLMLSFGMEMTFVFNEDGTGSMSMSYGEESDDETFAYTLENGQIVIDGEGAAYRIEDGLLHLTIDADALIFKRK